MSIASIVSTMCLQGTSRLWSLTSNYHFIFIFIFISIYQYYFTLPTVLETAVVPVIFCSQDFSSFWLLENGCSRIAHLLPHKCLIAKLKRKIVVFIFFLCVICILGSCPSREALVSGAGSLSKGLPPWSKYMALSLPTKWCLYGPEHPRLSAK